MDARMPYNEIPILNGQKLVSFGKIMGHSLCSRVNQTELKSDLASSGVILEANRSRSLIAPEKLPTFTKPIAASTGGG
eukprot:125167-Ditylum_brightwellii.AAC.1